MSPSTPVAPPVSTQFQLKLEKGKVFYQSVTTTATQTIKVQNGAELTQKHEQVFFYKWNPIDQAADGKWTVKQTIEGAKMTIDIAGNQVKYDSATPADSGTQPGLSDFFGKLVGSEFTVTFNKNMTVDKVEGKEAFLLKLGGVNSQMEAVLKKMLTDEALKQLVDPSFNIAPPTDQPVGGSWEKTSILTLGPVGSYELKCKYTYKGKDANQKELDRIDVNSTLKYKVPTEAADGLLFKIKAGEVNSLASTPDLDAKNFILYDPKLGRIVDASLVVKMKGTLTVAIGGTDTNVEINQEVATLVKTKDTSFLAPPSPPAGSPPPPATPPKP